MSRPSTTFKITFTYKRKSTDVLTCLYTPQLMKIKRDKCFERLTKLHKGKNTSSHVHINRRHKASLSMGIQSISKCEDKDCIWNVKSEDGKREYNKAQSQCKGDCFLKCTECNICIHSHECTCPDNFMKYRPISGSLSIIYSKTINYYRKLLVVRQDRTASNYMTNTIRHVLHTNVIVVRQDQTRQGLPEPT